MGSRLVFRRGNGRFRRAPSLEEMGFPVAKGSKMCECGHIWNPLVVTGICPECGSALGVMLDRRHPEAATRAPTHEELTEGREK